MATTNGPCHCHRAMSKPRLSGPQTRMSAHVARDTLWDWGPRRETDDAFPSTGTQSLPWCSVTAESTAPACGIVPQCPGSTGAATPGEDATLGTGCRTSTTGAETRWEKWGMGGGQCCTGHGTQKHLATAELREVRNSVMKVSVATLWEDNGPDAGWQVRISSSGICQRPAGLGNPSRGYGTFHCKQP